MTSETATEFGADYARRLQGGLQSSDWTAVGELARALRDCWDAGRQVFLCGNGGSAIHLANNYVYGIGKNGGLGLRALALPANPAVVTCIANDIGYERIFAAQLAVQGAAGDILIAFSGSGTRRTICARSNKRNRWAFAASRCSVIPAARPSYSLTSPSIDDIQISEDLQLVVGHMIMQWLSRNPPQSKDRA